MLCHGKLARAFYETVEKITGKAQNIICLSNEHLSLKEIESLLIEKVESFDTGEEIIMLVGIKGGSCWNAALKLAKTKNNIHVISGINLPMVITFSIKQNELSCNELVEKIINSGKTGIAIE